MVRKKATKQKKSTPLLVDYQYSERSYPTKGIIPMMYDLVDLLPADMKPHGTRIVGILTMSVIAIIAIFLIGAFTATLTGHSDQIMNIFTADITFVGILTVGAIVLVVRKSI